MTLKLKTKGESLLEVLLSALLMSVLILVIIHLAAISQNISSSLAERNLGSGTSELLTSKYLEINSGLPKYQVKEASTQETLLSEEVYGEKKLLVYGKSVNPYIVRYHFVVRSNTPWAKITEDLYYSYFTSPKDVRARSLN